MFSFTNHDFSFINYKLRSLIVLKSFMYIIMVLLWILTIILGFYSLIIIEKRIQQKIETQNQDFLQKSEFVFNRLIQSKEESHRYTLQMMDPMTRTIENIRMKIEDLEKKQSNRELNINHSLQNLLDTNKDLKNTINIFQNETVKVINAFRKPNMRGKWGEMQLKKIVEMTGMLPFCDFEVQNMIGDSKPDMVIKLPKGGVIFIDAKTPLDAYLSDNGDEEKTKKDNVKAIRTHIHLLSEKKYWQNGLSPEMVILFLPFEAPWYHALEVDPSLAEYALEKKIIVTTPMTLIGLLKVVFYGWQHVVIAQEAESLKKQLNC